MLRLHELGWGTKRIAAELGCARNTVKRYVRQGGWEPYRRPERSKLLDEHTELVRELFVQHRGNAAVVQQELAKAGVEVSLRTVERACAPHRQALRAAAKATVRFETQPGWQLQADFGACEVPIGDEAVTVHLAVLTLGYSRRTYVAAWPCERQSQWLQSIEDAFVYFGGVAGELLIDNARALVTRHDARTREVTFHPTLLSFCKHWGTTPRACAPYRARTKGKDERMVGYVKRNAIAGHRFASWEALSAHLQWWMREVADVRVHGTTGESPLARFEREEAAALRPLDGRGPFQLRRTLSRRVQSDCCVEVDTNHYSVPYRHIGQYVTVDVVGETVTVSQGDDVLARHAKRIGQRAWVVDPRHLDGIVRGDTARPAATSELLRPLSVYAAAVSGVAS